MFEALAEIALFVCNTAPAGFTVCAWLEMIPFVATNTFDTLRIRADGHHKHNKTMELESLCSSQKVEGAGVRLLT